MPPGLKKTFSQMRAKIFDIYATKSYSQEGEDMILQRIFAGKERGFYVDVGAHHPRRFSNTYLFYRRGWWGINVEPNPAGVRALQSDRGRDINLQLGVSDCPGSLEYYFFDEPALNTFDGELAQWRLANTSYRIVRTSDIPVERLDRILGAHVPPGMGIDFLTIDVEGLDFAVLKSNDWSAFRPKCVLVEALQTSLEDVIKGEIFQFMKEHGYELFAKTYNTLIFHERADMMLGSDNR